MNGAALPSMIGTSGEFSSTMTLSMPMLTSAASRCSTVSTDDLVARQPGRELDAAEVLHRGRHLVIAEVGAPETDAEVGRRRLERERDLVAGVKTDSDAGNLSDEVFAVRPLASLAAGDDAQPSSANAMPAMLTPAIVQAVTC